LSTLDYYIPRPPLSLFIENITYYQSAIPPHARERRLPDGLMSLVINLRDEQIRLYDHLHPDQLRSYGGIIINGARSEFTILDPTCLTEVLMVQFKPGGASPFLRLPASELYNTTLSLDLIWGAEALNLHQQLQDANTVERRFHIIEQFLLARLVRAIHPSIAFALQALEAAPYPPSIASITEQLALSQTRFIHLFREAVGLTPKQFARILRFQQVLLAVEKSAPQTWAELALTCGYYDQAHFIHDFQAFSGLTPTAYLAQRGQYRNHVPSFE